MNMTTIHTVSGSVKLIDKTGRKKHVVIPFERVIVVGDSDEELRADFMAKISRTIDPVFSPFRLGQIETAIKEKRFELSEFRSVGTHGRKII